MGTFLDALRTLKLWQIGVLLAVLLGAAGATYGIYAWLSGSGEVSLAEDQQLVPVQYGNLVNEVSTNGSLMFPSRETLSFGAQGTVGEVLVEEGQQVQEGEALASLDAATVASLDKAVAQARINLQNAEDALTEAQNPHTGLQIAQAEAAVTSAKLSLESAEDALARLLEPTSEDVVRAKAAVTSATLSLKSAEDALARLLEPTPEDVIRAKAAVTSATLSVKSAQEALDAAKGGPTEKEMAQAQSKVDSATASLADAQSDLKLAQKECDDNLEAAQEAFDTAAEDYQGVFEKWLGVVISDDETDLAPDVLLASWGIDLEVLFSPALRFQEIGFGAAAPPSDSPDTPWNEAVVYIWLNLYPGYILPTCDNQAVPTQGVCIEKEMDDAWEGYQEAKDNLDTVETQATKDIANAESAVTRAEENLSTEQDALAELQEAPDPLEIENKENQLELAQAALETAQEELTSLSNPDPLEIESKQNQLELAQAALESAQEELTSLSNPDPLEIEAKQKQVEVARLNRTEAEDKLAELLGSADPLEVAMREADVISAREALDAALQNSEKATLQAPMAGLVDVVNIAAGDEVKAGAVAIEIVDTSVVEMDGVVDEIDILFIHKGAQATVTMDALAGQALEGTVSEVSSTSTTYSGVVSYPIRIQLQVPEGIELREGLSATASIVIYEERNVLLVPLQAIYGTYQQPTVMVVSNGSIEERPVVLGNNDDFWTVVESGLSEGEQVVMEAQATTTSQFGFTMRQFEGQIPGSFPGGGVQIERTR